MIDAISTDMLALLNREPATIPWEKAGAEYVIESTGVFTNLEGVRSFLPCTP